MITKWLLWVLTNIKWDITQVVFLINGEPFWVYVNFKWILKATEGPSWAIHKNRSSIKTSGIPFQNSR